MASQLPRFSDKASWLDETGAYTQQLGRTSNLLPVCIGLYSVLHGQYRPLAGDANQEELPSELLAQLCKWAVTVWTLLRLLLQVQL